jgi:hypothetical protein
VNVLIVTTRIPQFLINAVTGDVEFLGSGNATYQELAKTKRDHESTSATVVGSLDSMVESSVRGEKCRVTRCPRRF